MRRHRLRVLAVLTLALLARTSSAQITNAFDSNVEGFFGTQSDAAQQSEGPTNPPPWSANAPGPYPLTGPPTVPPLYAGFPNPVLPITQNIPYAAPSGHISTTFIDGQGTTASYSIVGGFSGSGLFTSDAYAMILGPPMSLVQPASATGFAYEQASFAMAYSIGSAGILGGAVPPHPFVVSGTVLPGGYAQFGAEVDYWWVPVIPGTVIPSGPSINLGSLQYSFLQAGGGSFGSLVTQSPTSLLGATGVGFLEITGDIFVAGDPFSISVTSVPEPGGGVLATLGLIGLAAWVRRRRKVALCGSEVMN